MAGGLDATKVLIGAGIFSIGDYVPAGVPGTLQDVGHIKSPYELGAAFENFDVETERSTAPILTSPIKSDYTIKVAFHQAEYEWMRISFGLVSAQLTGGPANFVLKVTDRVEQYHQATLAVKGYGTNKLDTYTFWKIQPTSMDPISFGKAVEQMYVVTFRILRDDSVVGANAAKFFQRVGT